MQLLGPAPAVYDPRRSRLGCGCGGGGFVGNAPRCPASPRPRWGGTMDARTRLGPRASPDARSCGGGAGACCAGWLQLYEEIGNAGVVCRRCGISRPTLRKWWRRYQAEGEKGLEARSRQPRKTGQRSRRTREIPSAPFPRRGRRRRDCALRPARPRYRSLRVRRGIPRSAAATHVPIRAADIRGEP